MNINVPQEVRHIISELERNGHEAYIVGGCVRDSVLGVLPTDWDICTSAAPARTIECFRGYNIIETGLRHGTVTLVIDGKPFEITTYRIDGAYTDFRRPDDVTFTGNLKEDLSRRDFTINAMAYNPRTGLVDCFGGFSDLSAKVIRCVGDSNLRFGEDALRILRALRFASTLGFSVDDEMRAAVLNNKHLLQNIAAERKGNELNKLITGKDAGRVISEFAGVICEIIPELSCSGSWAHTLRGIDRAPADVIIRLSILLCSVGAAAANDVLTRLKYDNNTINSATRLILLCDEKIRADRVCVKTWLRGIGVDMFKRLVLLQKACEEADADVCKRDRIDTSGDVMVTCNEIIEQRQCWSLKDLAVNGNDLIKMGIPEGENIGIILNRLLDMVIDETVENKTESLLLVVARMMAVP